MKEKPKAQEFWSACRELKRQQDICHPLECTVRDRLRAWAEEDGQKTIAALIGVSPQYLNDILHDRRAISRAFLEEVRDKVIW